MKRLRQATQVTINALTISALCAHLLVAGLAAAGSPPEFAASLSTSVAHVTTSPPRDVLVARSHTATFSLHQNTRRTDSFAAALVTAYACPAFAPFQTRAVDPPAAGSSASLLPAASRAPPSLVA